MVDQDWISSSPSQEQASRYISAPGTSMLNMTESPIVNHQSQDFPICPNHSCPFETASHALPIDPSLSLPTSTSPTSHPQWQSHQQMSHDKLGPLQRAASEPTQVFRSSDRDQVFASPLGPEALLGHSSRYTSHPLAAAGLGAPTPWLTGRISNPSSQVFQMRQEPFTGIPSRTATPTWTAHAPQNLQYDTTSVYPQRTDGQASQMEQVTVHGAPTSAPSSFAPAVNICGACQGSGFVIHHHGVSSPSGSGCTDPAASQYPDLGPDDPFR